MEEQKNEVAVRRDVSAPELAHHWQFIDQVASEAPRTREELREESKMDDPQHPSH
jgi:hypothetical protein